MHPDIIEPGTDGTKVYLLERELPENSMGNPASIVLVYMVKDMPEFITWIRIKPDDEPPYVVSGHYYPVTVEGLTNALQDYGERK